MVEAVAINCLTMVVDGRELAYRISLVNEDKQCIYDNYVLNESAEFADYKNADPSLSPYTMTLRGKSLATVKSEVAPMIRKRVLIGHDLDGDLKSLGLCHPDWNKRDTAEYPSFRTRKGMQPSLCNLAKFRLGMDIQNGMDSAENALAAMSLYKKYQNQWETWLKENDDESEASGDEDWSDVEEMEAIAIDCEMVEAGKRSIAGKVSLVNEQGTCVYDTYIKPREKITDYRTWVSGLTPELLARGKPFTDVKSDIASWIRQRILVGHDLDKDLKSLGLSHPDWNKRDTSEYPGFRTRKGNRPSLRNLALKHLGLSIQNGEHDSVQDAVAAMRLYKMYETEWEDWLAESTDEE